MNPLLIALGSKLIDRFIPDEKHAAEAKVELIEAEQRGELAHLDAQMQIMLAEAKSADPWTSRARPSFMYVFYVILIMNCLVIPILGIWNQAEMMAYYTNLKSGMEAIPTELWALFGTCFTGYTLSRSYDKNAILQSKRTVAERLGGIMGR